MEKTLYKWLLLPLLCCLVAVVQGCSNDVASPEEEQTSSDGGTYITLTARGIVTSLENGGDFEQYVKSLRIIGFDASGTLVCNQLFKAKDEENAKVWTSSNDKITIRETLGNATGTCTFYFIANEEGHTQAGTTSSLTDALKANDLTAGTLDAMGVAFAADEITKNTDTPIIMTKRQQAVIMAGQTTSISVDLVRALAKATLNLKRGEGNETAYTVGTIRIEDCTKIPSSYPLMEEGSTYTVPENHKLSTATINLKGTQGATVADDIYNSDPIYLPQLTLTNADDAVNVTGQITPTGQTAQTFTEPVGDPDNNFSIARNTSYTTNITYLYQKAPQTFSLGFEVIAWDTDKDVTVPPFN